MSIKSPDPSEDKSEHVKEIEELDASGGLGRIAQLIKTNADVWIKRDSGEWQKGKAWEVGHAGLSVGVKWFDEEHNQEVGKHVRAKDFLEWQDQHK